MTKTCLTVFCLTAVVATGSAGQAPAQDLVATVNGTGITRVEFDRSFKAYLQQRGIPQQHLEKADQFGDLKMEAINMLIDQELLYQEAKKKDFIADPERLAGEIAPIRARFPSPEDFAKVLKEQGFTEETFADIVERRLSVQTLVETDIAKGISVSDEEVSEFYTNNPEQFKRPETVRARHILRKVEPGADSSSRDEVKKKIGEILKEAESGADFAELAVQYSEGPSAKRGGDLGFFPRGKMVKPFDEAVFSLEPGKISGIVETKYGFHIIKVEEKKEAAILSKEEVADELNGFLTSGKIKQAVRDRLGIMRKQAKIEILIEE
jgi:peptidyl-prolyl cis-trans isomerase C